MSRRGGASGPRSGPAGSRGKASAPGSTSSGAKLRPLNRPRPVRVVTGDDGLPARVQARGRWRDVSGVLDRWRIDDEWWREPISRIYLTLVLEGGGHLTLYRDLIEDRWYAQSR